MLPYFNFLMVSLFLVYVEFVEVSFALPINSKMPLALSLKDTAQLLE
jgi:hypothetical protein